MALACHVARGLSRQHLLPAAAAAAARRRRQPARAHASAGHGDRFAVSGRGGGGGSLPRRAGAGAGAVEAASPADAPPVHPGPHEDLEAISALFSAFAKNDILPSGQPVIDRQGLRSMLRALGERPSAARLHRIFHEVDKDDSGHIDHDEFIRHRVVILSHADNSDMARVLATGARGKDAAGPLSDPAGIIQAFNMLDKDGDGLLSVKDLTGLLSTTGGHLSEEDAASLIASADKDSNSLIDIQEFFEFLSSKKFCTSSWRLRSGFRAVPVIGAPCSGKSLLCERLVRRLGMHHMSMDDLLREQQEALERADAAPRRSSMGKLGDRRSSDADSDSDSQSSLDTENADDDRSPRKLTDHEVVALLRREFAEHPVSYVALEGFPRNASDCVKFETECGRPDFAVSLEVPDDVLTERCGAEEPDAFRESLRVFREEHSQVLDYFREHGIQVHVLDGALPPDAVWTKLLECSPILARRDQSTL